jgi:hypothetical protein
MSLPFPLVTAADYINGRVLRHMRQLRPGWTASPELQQDILQEWQAFIDDTLTQPDLAPSVPMYTYPITGPGYLGNNRDYQIGPGAADFNGPRPTKLRKASLLITTTAINSRIPVNIRSWSEYASISVLTIPATQIATDLYVEETWPIAVLHFWPPINANSIILWPEGALVAPAELTTTVAGTFPPGYENFIIYGVAVRSSHLGTHEMGPPNPRLPAMALRAKQLVRNANATNPPAPSDFQTPPVSGRGVTSGNLTLIGEL